MTLKTVLAPVALVCLMLTTTTDATCAHRFLRSHIEELHERPFAATSLIHRARMIAQDFPNLWTQELAGSEDTPRTLAGEDEQQIDVCTILEAFTLKHHNRICNCAANHQTTNFFDFMWSCESLERDCKENIFGDTFCANYTYSIVFDNLLKISEYYICLSNYTVNDDPFDDICVNVKYCHDKIFPTICGCDVQIAGVDCACSLCYNGFGVFLDCSDYHPDAVSTSCTEVDREFDEEKDGVDVFYPNFKAEPRTTNWCQVVNDFFVSNNPGQVSCRCTEDAHNAESAFLSCQTNGTVCILPETDWRLCADIETNITIEDGKVTTLIACSNAEAPVDFEEFCIAVEICSYGDLSASSSLVCGINVTYGGNPCDLVTCGSGFNTTFTVHCTDSVVIDKCIDASDIARLTSYVPRYSKDAKISSPMPLSDTPIQDNGGSFSLCPFYQGSMVFVMVMAATALLIGL